MQPELNLPVMAIVNDIEALIAEIDENPALSPWVVRLILKSIKDKARKMVGESPLKKVYLEDLPTLNPSLSASAIHAQTINALPRLP